MDKHNLSLILKYISLSITEPVPQKLYAYKKKNIYPNSFQCKSLGLNPKL